MAAPPPAAPAAPPPALPAGASEDLLEALRGRLAAGLRDFGEDVVRRAFAELGDRLVAELLEELRAPRTASTPKGCKDKLPARPESPAKVVRIDPSIGGNEFGADADACKRKAVPLSVPSIVVEPPDARDVRPDARKVRPHLEPLGPLRGLANVEDGFARQGTAGVPPGSPWGRALPELPSQPQEEPEAEGSPSPPSVTQPPPPPPPPARPVPACLLLPPSAAIPAATAATGPQLEAQRTQRAADTPKQAVAQTLFVRQDSKLSQASHGEAFFRGGLQVPLQRNRDVCMGTATAPPGMDFRPPHARPHDDAKVLHRQQEQECLLVDDDDDAFLKLGRRYIVRQELGDVLPHIGHKRSKRGSRASEVCRPQLTRQKSEVPQNFFAWRPGEEPSASESLEVLGPRATIQYLPEHNTRSGLPLLVQRFLCGDWTCLSLVTSSFFDYSMSFIIVLNALSIGVQTEFMAANNSDNGIWVLEVLDKILCVIFTVEIILRMVGHRLAFFVGHTWKWNVFDLLLVTAQLTEELSILFAEYNWNKLKVNFSFMRILRVLRLVRIVRVVRVLRLVSELHTIVIAVLGTLRSLLWTVVLLLLLIYVVGVYLTQTCLDYRLRNTGGEHSDFDDMERYFGSLARSALTLFQAITSGLDWSGPSEVLMQDLHPAFGAFFLTYVIFSELCILNVVTGVFVEAALKSAQHEDQIYMVHHLRALFQSTDRDKSGLITSEEFSARVKDKEMQMYFKSIDVDPGEAQALFRLLDVDGSGAVDMMEFVAGCLRLRGQAKAIDLMTCMHETRRVSRKLREHARSADERMAAIQSDLQWILLVLEGGARSMTTMSIPDQASSVLEELV